MAREFERFPTIGANAINPDYDSLPNKWIIDINQYRKSHTEVKRESKAFRPEFYEQAGKQQVIDDLTSFFGEYIFKVPEFDYRIKIGQGRLLDPNTGEDMEEKAQKAIEDREKNHLATSREIAEKEGLNAIRNQLTQNPNGTVVWFSPPGSQEDGYGKHGFGFVGKINGEMLEMTAIRLENPKLSNFNEASNALWQGSYESAEDFLRSPKVVDIAPSIVKEFIYGNFEIRDTKAKDIFIRSIYKLRAAIDNAAGVIQKGTQKNKTLAINVLANMAEELNNRLNMSYDRNAVFFADYKEVNFYDAMQMTRYAKTPPPVAGSCGMSGKIESVNILGKLVGSMENSLYNKTNQEWFNCPKCKYKAGGPVGNKCPGCGLTKEQYVKQGGKTC